MDRIQHLERFMSRRKWDVLAAHYRCSVYTMHKAIRENRRPRTLTPDEWDEVLVYREEWHKAKRELLKVTT